MHSLDIYLKHTSDIFFNLRKKKMKHFSSLYIFLLFLSLACPCMATIRPETIVVFKGNQTEVPYTEKNNAITMRKPRAFRVPAFVGGVFNNKEFLAVFCDARYHGFSDWSFIEAAAKTSYGDYKNWSDAEIFVQNTRKSATHSVVGDVTAVIKKNKIFVLAPSWDASKWSWTHHNSNTGWDSLLITGTIVNLTDAKGDRAFIKWSKGKSLKNQLPQSVHGANGSQFVGGVGNGMVMKNGTIVFPLQIANSKKHVSAFIMYSTDDGENWIMGGTTPPGPSECSVVEWEKDKLILTTRYDGGFRIVYESDNMGKSWKESLMFSRVWGNQPNRRGPGSQGSAITADVHGKDILLFSHPLNRRGGYTRDTLQLWMSDGKRIMCVGTISEKGKGERSGYSILAFVADNLYIVHEINPFGSWGNYHAQLKEWDRVIALSPLTHFFENIKKTVRHWQELDTILKTKGIPTDALVGFLGNNIHDTVWEDMYNCVNATLKGGKSVDGGLCFNGKTKNGAKWPVASQGQNQLYMFTKHQFTIAATVIIHTASKDTDISILGASSNDKKNSVLIGIGYSKNKEWFTINNNDKQTTPKALIEFGKVYHISVTFDNGVGSVFVDSVAIAQGEINLSGTVSISHFFMGRLGNSSSTIRDSCTIKNVMLFNRALSQNEIFQFINIDKRNKPEEKTLTEELEIQYNKTGLVSEIQLTSTSQKRTAVSTIESQKILLSSSKKINNGGKNDKKINSSVFKISDVSFDKQINGNRSAVVQLFVIGAIDFICSFILLTIF